MESFFLQFGGEIITALSSFILALIARSHEKKVLKSKGLLKDAPQTDSMKVVK